MRPYLFLVLSLVIISAIIIVGFPTPPDFLNEGAFVETSSVVLYGVTITFLLWLRPMKELKDTLLCAAVTLCLMLRELDFDKKFTDLGVFKGKFYKSAEIPIIQKLVGLFIILTLLALVITLLVRHTKPLLRGLKENHRAKYGVITAIILAFVSKAFLDGMPRKLGDFGIKTPAALIHGHGTLEEILELGIPIALLMALYFKQKERKETL